MVYSGDSSPLRLTRRESPELDRLENQMTSELATIFAAVIGALMIIVQMGRQHQNELERQERATRDKLKLEIYQEISEVMTIANDALLEA